MDPRHGLIAKLLHTKLAALGGVPGSVAPRSLQGEPNAVVTLAVT